MGHKGALALDAVQVLLPHQVGDGLAHGGTADAEHLAELHFGGNHAPHRVISVVDLLQDQLFKLEIRGIGTSLSSLLSSSMARSLPLFLQSLL